MVPSLSDDGNGDDNGELMHTENEGMPSETTEPDEKRATVSGTLWHAIYGKSKALVFGQVLSLFLVSIASENFRVSVYRCFTTCT